MTTHAIGIFEQNGWDEKPYAELDGGRKLTRASVTQLFHGDIEGEGSVEYLMIYPDEKSASFVGMQLVTGTLGGRSGSFVLQTSGTFANGIVNGNWFVVPGSGTGELESLRGQGEFRASQGPKAEITLDYEIG